METKLTPKEQEYLTTLEKKYQVTHQISNQNIIFITHPTNHNFISQLLENNIKLYLEKDLTTLKITINSKELKEIATNELTSDELTQLFLTFLEKCIWIKLSLKKISSIIKLELFSSCYSYILSECRLPNSTTYQITNNNIKQILPKIEIYNQLLKTTPIQINKKITTPNLSIIKNLIENQHPKKIIIINNQTTINLIVANQTTLEFIFSNPPNFEKIILPEILKSYSTTINSLKKEQKLNNFNKQYYKTNDQLYILNFYDEILEENIKYLHHLVESTKNHLELNKNITFTKEYDSPINPPTQYNYGYINILLISFIISILTIIICLLKL